VAKGTCFTRLVGLNVTDDCHIILVFLERGVAKLNPQQESQHELKTLAPLLFTSFSPMEGK
jgi:hypothetical protein